MLIGNGSLVHRQLCRQIGGVLSVDIYCWGRTERLNRFAGGVSPIFGAVPTGYGAPLALLMPRKPGGLSSFAQASALLELGPLSLAEGRSLGTGTAAISLVSGTVDLQLVVSAEGSADFAISGTALISGAQFAEGNAAISITLSDALLGALADAVAEGSISLSSAGTIRATGALAGDITPFTELSPQSLASAVWGSLASANNTAGSMGEKLNDAGSASNPWTEAIESGYTAADILRLIAAVTAGKVSGGPGSPVFRDLGDTKNRVTGTADSNGNRTAVTYDAS